MSSLKNNVVLNAINTITKILFPVVTFPYASRILEPDGIGTVNFLSSIVQYIVLLTSLGIPMYAVREIAKYRNDLGTRNTIVFEVILLSASLCAIGYLIVFLLESFVPQIHNQAKLFYILSLTIIFTGIGVEWFYQGIEDFKFITIRGIIVRTIAAASIFFFVKEKDDLLMYGAITVGSSVGNNIINFFHLWRYVGIPTIQWRKLNVFRHLKPAVRIFLLNLIISLYVSLDSIMLGFMQGDVAVGYYTAAVKLSHTVLTIVTSLGVVMIPRCSNLVQNGDMDGFARVCNKAIRLVIAAAFPIMTGLIFLAYPVIMLFCGDDFLPSVFVLRWVSPIILFVGITNVLGLQVLYPQNKENIVISSVTGGAVLNIILNILLIPRYAQFGAAIATLMAEGMVLVLQIVFGRKYIPFNFKDCYIGRYLFATFVMCISILPVLFFLHNDVMQIILAVGIGAAVYGGILLIFKDEIAEELLAMIKQKHI